jgi:hypothetical protein
VIKINHSNIPKRVHDCIKSREKNRSLMIIRGISKSTFRIQNFTKIKKDFEGREKRWEMVIWVKLKSYYWTGEIQNIDQVNK